MPGINFGQVGGLLQKLSRPVMSSLKGSLLMAGRRAGPAARRGAGEIQLGTPAITAASKPDPGVLASNARILANWRPAQAWAAGTVGLGAYGLGSNTDAIEKKINEAGPALDRLVSNIVPDSIERPLMDFARGQEKKGLGGALEMATPLGFLVSPAIPNDMTTTKVNIGKNAADPGAHPFGTQAVLNGKPVYWGGKDFGWQQANGGGSSATLNTLNAPGVQNRFIQDRPASSGESPAAKRNYEAEKSSVAQQAAQDTLNKKYNIAELTKQYQAAQASKDNDAATKIGMQIWAQTNPQLAGQVQSGQSGYEAIGMTPGMQRPSYTATNYFNPPAAGVADEKGGLEPTSGAGISSIANSFSTQPLDLNKLLGGSQSGFDPSKMNYDMSAGEKFSIPGVSPEDLYKMNLNLQTPEAQAQRFKDGELAKQMYMKLGV